MNNLLILAYCLVATCHYQQHTTQRTKQHLLLTRNLHAGGCTHGAVSVSVGTPLGSERTVHHVMNGHRMCGIRKTSEEIYWLRNCVRVQAKDCLLILEFTN